MTPSRAGALLILAGLMALVWIGPVAAYRTLVADGADRLASAEAALARDRAVLDAPPPPMAPLAAAVALFPTNSAAQDGALLQQMLKQAASTAQVEIEGLQVLEPDAIEGTTRFGVRIKGRADIGALDHLVYAIETAPRLLYADNLHIVAPATGPLEFELEVAGFAPGAPQ